MIGVRICFLFWYGIDVINIIDEFVRIWNHVNSLLVGWLRMMRLFGWVGRWQSDRNRYLDRWWKNVRYPFHDWQRLLYHFMVHFDFMIDRIWVAAGHRRRMFRKWFERMTRTGSKCRIVIWRCERVEVTERWAGPSITRETSNTRHSRNRVSVVARIKMSIVGTNWQHSKWTHPNSTKTWKR